MENEKIIDAYKTGDAEIQIVELTKLKGANTSDLATQLFFMERAGVSLKFIRAVLDGGSFITEHGSFYYSKGDIETSVLNGGFAKNVTRKALTKEKIFMPIYTGFGEVTLLPTFAHFMLLPLNNESFIVDKGTFFAAIGDIKIGTASQSNVSSVVLGREGIFQTKISGTGVAALLLSVPMSEIEIINMEDDRMQVDGNFAVLRSDSIRFSVQKSAKTLAGTAMSGEMFLQTYEGTGQVWLAPTAPIYSGIEQGAVEMVSGYQEQDNNNVQ